MGTIRIVDFGDYEQLHKEDNGLFSTAQAPAAARRNGPSLSGRVWRSPTWIWWTR
ncbi:hypothetical protein [Enterocloster sp.]|uniref:hypothetical protein n=1 Tax=Enterocloster sp. TaxID=2719315 RepID=UPI0039A3AE58